MADVAHPARALTVLLAALLLAMPASARAGTIGLEGTELVYRSAPGEADDFVAQDNPEDVPGKLVVYERGTKLTPGAGCGRGKFYLECSTQGVTAMRVFAADGDDRVAVLLRMPVFVDLGPGNDTYGGRATTLTLTAGDGRDDVEAEPGGGAIDLGPGNDHGYVSLASNFPGPLTLEGRDGDDRLELSGFAEPGVRASGGAGDDTILVGLYGGAESTGTAVDVACGPGSDSTQLRLFDHAGDGCAPVPTAITPSRVSRIFREGILAGPARVDIRFRRRPGGGRRPAELLARGSADRPAGPVRLRLKATAAGRRRLEPDLKLYVFIRTQTGGDRSKVRFDSRLAG